MSALLTLPRLGETMESGRVVAWLKQPGERFARGEVVAEIETDKTNVELPALDDGVLTAILAPEGTVVTVGEPIGRYHPAGAVDPTVESREAASSRPLADLVLPRLGETMESGRLVAWLKQPGERFARGDLLLEIETDKTTVEYPALDDGTLVEIVVAVGETVDVGTVIGRYAAAGPAAAASPAASLSPAAVLGPEPSEGRGEAPVRPANSGAPNPSSAVGGLHPHPRATPLARRLAREAGLDLRSIAGTGRRGRVERADVEAARGAPSGSEADRQPASASLAHVGVPAGTVAYRVWGAADAARTIVLVHGFGGDGQTWTTLATQLARSGARVVTPDLPGHGTTTIEAGTVGDLATVLADFVAALAIPSAELVGHSLGAAVAVKAVRAGRLQPKRLTLLAPAGLGSEIDADFVAGMATVRSGGALAHLLRRLARRTPVLSAAELDAMAARTGSGRLTSLAAALAADGRQQIDIVADLAALTAPTRIVWGLDDRIVPWTQVADAPSRIAIHLIAGAGHMPHWDAQQEVAALLA